MNKELKNKKEYWITPPDVYKKLDDEFHFDFDPCPYPYQGFDGIEVEWGKSTYCNPPFNKLDNQCGRSMTDWIRKGIDENKKGKDVVIVFNTRNLFNMLIEAGAEVRSLGRVKWLDGKTREPWKSPSNTTCFILRGKKESIITQPENEWKEECEIEKIKLRYLVKLYEVSGIKSKDGHDKEIEELTDQFLQSILSQRDKEWREKIENMKCDYPKSSSQKEHQINIEIIERTVNQIREALLKQTK
jgi:uncharacterized protein YihD (DUF1040 family)